MSDDTLFSSDSKIIPREILHNITVLIPTLGRPALKDCLRSIISGNAWPAAIIVVNQGSNPDVAHWLELCQSLGIDSSHIRSNQKGPAAARNRGIELIKTEYIAATDDDCTVSNDWLQLLMARLENNSGSIITGKVEPGGDGEVLSTVTSNNPVSYTRPLLIQDILFTGNMGCARNIFLRIGLFDESLHTAEDHDWSYRALRAGIPIIYAPDVVVKHFDRRDNNQRMDRLRAYNRGQGAFYGKYIRKGDWFICLRALIFISINMLKVVKGVMTSNRDMSARRRAFIIDLMKGIVSRRGYFSE